MESVSHLKALQAVEMAVRTGSFTRAAERLFISPPAVGQRVRSLESYLGIELLARGRAGVRPAPELSSALPHLHRAFSELESVGRELDLQRGHEIHVAAATDFAELWLRRRLDRFRAMHPRVRFNINGEGEAPIRIGHIDCEITFARPDDDGRTDVLFHDFVLPVGSPANLERTAGLDDREKLEGFPLLHIDFYKEDTAGLSWPAWVARNEVRRSAPDRGIRFRNIRTAVDAAVADSGFAMCGLALIDDLVDRGQLDMPYAISTGCWSEHAFVARYRDGSSARPHVRRFRAWLAEESLVTARWLEAATGPEPGERRPAD